MHELLSIFCLLIHKTILKYLWNIGNAPGVILSKRKYKENEILI